MQPSSYFCPHVFYLHSTEEPNNLNFEKSELRNVRCKQQASVLTNRGFVWEICCVTSFFSLSVFMCSLTFVETTEQLVKIAELATSHD